MSVFPSEKVLCETRKAKPARHRLSEPIWVQFLKELFAHTDFTLKLVVKNTQWKNPPFGARKHSVVLLLVGWAAW